MGFKLKSGNKTNFKSMGSTNPTGGVKSVKKVSNGGEAQDQNKIFDNKGNHVGDYVNDKKVMKPKQSRESAHGQLGDAANEYKQDKLRASKIKKGEQKQPTYENTDEYRKEKDIPKKEKSPAKMKKKKSKVKTTRTKNSITKSDGKKSSTYNMDNSKTKKSKDGKTTSYTFTNKLGNSINETHGSSPAKQKNFNRTGGPDKEMDALGKKASEKMRSKRVPKMDMTLNDNLNKAVRGTKKDLPKNFNATGTSKAGKFAKVAKKVIGKAGKFLGGKTLGVAGMMMATSSKADQPTKGKGKKEYEGGKIDFTKKK